MPMLHPPKPSRSADLEREPAPRSAEARRAERRRLERLYEIEFFRSERYSDDDDLLGSRRAAPEAMDHPAQTSGAAALPRDPRLVRALEAARRGWVIERYSSAERGVATR